MQSSNEQSEFPLTEDPRVAEAERVRPITDAGQPAPPIPHERLRIGIPHAPWRYTLNQKRRNIDGDDWDVPVC